MWYLFTLSYRIESITYVNKSQNKPKIYLIVDDMGIQKETLWTKLNSGINFLSSDGRMYKVK